MKNKNNNSTDDALGNKPNWWHRLDQVGKLILIVSVLLLIALFLLPDKFVNYAYFGLVVMTMVYAYFTGKQAEANFRMLEEMKEERLIASQPVIIPKSANLYGGDGFDTKRFSHFLIFNAGNGTAIGLKYAISNNEKSKFLEVSRETYLKAGEELQYSPNWTILKRGKYFLFCQYFGISQVTGKKRFNQTWLPFEVVTAESKDVTLSIVAFDPAFEFDVNEKDAIKMYIAIEAV